MMIKISKERFFKNYLALTDMQYFHTAKVDEALVTIKKAFFDYRINSQKTEDVDTLKFSKFGFKLRKCYELEKSVFKFGGIGFIGKENKSRECDGAINVLFERGAINIESTYTGEDTFTDTMAHMRLENGRRIGVQRKNRFVAPYIA